MDDLSDSDLENIIRASPMQNQAVMSLMMTAGDEEHVHHLYWDDLLDAVARPGGLQAYLVDDINREALVTHAALLGAMLQVNTRLLRIPKIADSFDRATFCLGHLLSHEPEAMSNLPCVESVISGLSSALDSGWDVHHGVAKFAANALTILGSCETALPRIRVLAMRGLLDRLD